MRDTLDNYAENAYIVAGEDADRARGVDHWTYEQYLLAHQNMEKKIERIKRARKKK